MHLNLIAFIYYCSLVYLLGSVNSSDAGSETFQYFDTSEQKTHNDELVDDGSYRNNFLDDRNKRSSNAYANSLAKTSSDSGEIISNGYLYGRPSSSSANSQAYSNTYGEVYGDGASSANAQASALSSGYGYPPKAAVVRPPVINSVMRAPPTVAVVPYAVGGGSYSSSISDAASRLSSSSSNSLVQSGSYGLNNVDLGSLWPGFGAPAPSNFANALPNRPSSSNQLPQIVSSLQGCPIPSYAPAPKWIPVPEPYMASPFNLGGNNFASGNGYSSSNVNAEAASYGSALNSILGGLGGGNWEAFDPPSPANAYTASDAAINAYGDVQAKAIGQTLGRRFLGNLLRNFLNPDPNTHSIPINSFSSPVYPAAPPLVYPTIYPKSTPYPVYHPRPVYPGMENAYPVLPNVVAPRKPKIILNADAVAQKDGTLKAVIEAILEARRRSGIPVQN